MAQKVQRTCEACGKGFWTWASEVHKGGGRYCSRACYLSVKNRPVEKICVGCGSSFLALPADLKRGGGLYCTRKCYNTSNNRTPAETITCLHCGKVFKASVREKRKYCSTDCFLAEKGRIAGTVEVTCDICGKPFQARPKKKQRYCGVECRNLADRTRQERTCLICGKKFTKVPAVIATGRGKYCSNECRYVAESLNRRAENSPFWKGGARINRGPNWSSQRRLARQRDGNVCQYCQRAPKPGEKRFHIHHIVPYRAFDGDYEAANHLSNLITLCPQCHKKAEFGKITIRPKSL